MATLRYFAFRGSFGSPRPTREILEWSRLFNLSVHGARLLYNLRCSELKEHEALSSKYRKGLEQWRDEAVQAGLPGSWPAPEFWSWISWARPSGITRVQRFHERWMRCLDDTLDVAESSAARSLVADRETQLKKSLARLRPGGSRRLDTYEGDAGIRHYDYNWSIACRALRDIHAGLKTEG